MKVKLKDIKPNPWRYINKGYPIDPAKIEHLRKSIQRTGFWDNILGRSINGHIEIAYGHHRLEALKKEYPKDHEVNITIRNLDDATMLKIMAHENEMMDQMSPAIINETVRAARDFLKKHKSTGTGTRELWEREEIAKFLDWPIERIKHALAALSDIEKGLISKDEYESIKYQRAAEEYRRQIKINPLSKKDRNKIINRLKEGNISVIGVKQEILNAKFKGKEKPRKKEIDIEDLASQLAKDIDHASLLLSDLFINNFDHLNPGTKGNIVRACRNLFTKLGKLESKYKRIKLIGAAK